MHLFALERIRDQFIAARNTSSEPAVIEAMTVGIDDLDSHMLMLARRASGDVPDFAAKLFRLSADLNAARSAALEHVS